MSNHSQPLRALMLGALGVVFGDIGTSPLYTLRECLKAAGGVTPATVYGLLSLIAWAILVVVTLKYVFFVMRADNNGEGGILALMALVTDKAPRKARYALALLGLFGAAMFYGDSMVTPAISVLSAVEGLQVLQPGLGRFVVPVSLVILAGLFYAQKRGTASIGAFFGPAMLGWFALLSVMGFVQIYQHPEVLRALSPMYAIHFVVSAPGVAFTVLASVFLALTGGEALFADMGHFGKTPIQKAWLYLVFPSLVVNYFGQGALVLHDSHAIDSPFFNMVPGWATAALVVASTVATVIASQAVISGAFSMTKQGISLGYLPRLNVVHTSAQEIGQIYVPVINTMLFVAVTFLVLFFRSSDNLAAAYGIAVASTMMLTTVFMFLVAHYIWGWKLPKSLSITGALLVVDAIFVGANASKVLEGGWFPLLMGLGIFALMTTWKRGRMLVQQEIRTHNLRLDEFITGLCAPGHRPMRVEGTAVFLNSVAGVTPSSFMHNLKHNKVLHDSNLFITLQTATTPFVRNDQKLEIVELGHRCYSVTAKLGFKESPDVPHLLTLAQQHLSNWNYDEMTTSFFLNRETVVASTKDERGMALWREKLYAFLQRNAGKAAEYFSLPANRVIEMGSQVSI